jgi:hypothetical protein
VRFDPAAEQLDGTEVRHLDPETVLLTLEESVR